MFTNHVKAEIFPGIFINDISDHLPLFAYVSKYSGNDIQTRSDGKFVQNFSDATRSFVIV